MMTLILGLLNDIPLRDVAGRYAPMADAFASGNFLYAFHIRIPPLHTMTSGIIAFITGLDGFSACKTAASIWYFAGMFVFYKLIQTVYPEDKRVQVLCVALYAVFPYTCQMAYCGLREPIKTFVFTASALNLIKIKNDPENIYNYILLGMLCSVASITRSDMMFSSLFLLFAGTYFECRHKKFPKLSIISYIISQALVIPNVCINYFMFKSAMPDFRLSAAYQRYIGGVPDPRNYIASLLAVYLVTFAAAWIFEKITRKIKAEYFVFSGIFIIISSNIITAARINFNFDITSKFLESVMEGFHSFFGIISAIYLIIRYKNRKLTSDEAVLFTLVFINAFIAILSIQFYDKSLYVSSRYLHPVLPLFFGFFICALKKMHSFINEKFSPKWAKVFLICAAVYIPGDMIFHSAQPIIRNFTRKKSIIQRRKVFKITEIIKQDFKEKKENTPQVFNSDPLFYTANKHPKVYVKGDSKISVAAYLAGGSLTYSPKDADYIITEKNDMPEKKNLILLGCAEGLKNTFNLWKVEK